MSTSLYFFDSRVADLDTLIAALPEGASYVVLDRNRDGLQQIREALTGMSAVDSIQIVSFGRSGSVTLGSTVLTSSNLAAYRNELAAIGQSLSADGDILLYGCNVGAGSAGKSFVNKLASYTGADVAASSNKTGRGGDWVLEVASGSIESDGAVFASSGYGYTLDLFMGTDGNDTLSGTSSDDGMYGLGGNDSIRGNAGNDTMEGGAGNDTLNGGAGDDSMTGGRNIGGRSFRE